MGKFSTVQLARSDSERRSQTPDHVDNSNLATISHLYPPLSYTHTQPPIHISQPCTEKFLPARRYTSAVLVTAEFLSVCLSVCLSARVCHRSFFDTDFFSSSPTWRYKEILLSIKSRHFRLEVSTKLRT